jgi:hypothetical protein
VPNKREESASELSRASVEKCTIYVKLQQCTHFLNLIIKPAEIHLRVIFT